jgi:hypothetical protein
MKLLRFGELGSEGDIVRAGITGLGEQCHRAISWQSTQGNEQQRRSAVA